jgi:hypothetical protein
MHQRGLDAPTRTAPLNVVYPLLEAASIEQEDDLQQLFAALLVNAIDADSGVSVLKSFVDVVRTMSPLEARILAKLVDTPPKFRRGEMIITGVLPEEYVEHSKDREPPSLPENVELALSNLVRNGCIYAAGTWGGGTSLQVVGVTPFGHAFMRACRSPKDTGT